MTAYCVNSGNTHSTLYVAENAEHGQHVGLVIFLITGFDTSSPVFSGSGYDDVEIRPTGGYEWDGVESNLTAGIGSINSSADSLTVQNLGIKYYNAANGPLNVASNCLIGHGDTGGTVFSAGNVSPAILNNCIVKGTIKTTSAFNGNLQANNTTIISANGYGAIRADAKNSAILNTGSATVVQGSELNVYSDDGAGGTVNNLSESDFVDYANGDYRLKADSAAALAGAGAFIVTGQAPTEIEASITESLSLISDGLSANVDVQAVITEGLQSLTESVYVDLSQNISVGIVETLSELTDQVAVDLSNNVSASIAESLSSISDLASAQFTVQASVTEVISSIEDQVLVGLEVELEASITEDLKGLTELMQITLPVQFSVNGRRTSKFNSARTSVRFGKSSRSTRF